MSRKDMKVQDHRKVRRAEKQALDGGHVRDVWASRLPLTPIVDDVMPYRSKKKGCKRNKGGKREIELWPQTVPAFTTVWNEEKQRVETVWTPWWQRRRHPDYRCRKCHKGFYSLPRDGKRVDTQEIERTLMSASNPTPEDLADHWSIYNIKIRLLGLTCKCPGCNDG